MSKCDLIISKYKKAWSYKIKMKYLIDRTCEKTERM